MHKQEFKIECNSTAVYFFAHGLKTALEHATEYVKRNKHLEMKVFCLNESNYGDRWIPFRIDYKEVKNMAVIKVFSDRCETVPLAVYESNVIPRIGEAIAIPHVDGMLHITDKVHGIDHVVGSNNLTYVRIHVRKGDVTFPISHYNEQGGTP